MRRCDVFVNRNCVDTRWQQYSTHLHTNNTQKNTVNFGRVRAVPCLCELYPGNCISTEEKVRKNLSQGSRKVSIHRLTIKIYDMIYLLTAIGLSPGDRNTVHIYTQTVHRTTQHFGKSAGRAPCLRVIPWHLPYN